MRCDASPGGRASRGSQFDSGSGSSGGNLHESWESRASYADRSTERAADRERYDGDRRGEPARDSSYDRRGGHADRERRENRDRGERSLDRRQGCPYRRGIMVVATSEKAYECSTAVCQGVSWEFTVLAVSQIECLHR